MMRLRATQIYAEVSCLMYNMSQNRSDILLKKLQQILG